MLSRQTPEEATRKRRINDLVSILSLRSLWNGADRASVATTLTDLLLQLFDADLALVRLAAGEGEEDVEIYRVAPGSRTTITQSCLVAHVADWLCGDRSPGIRVGGLGFGSQLVSLMATNRGMQDDFGLIVVGSCSSTFPTESERLLLDIAANEALICLQDRRRWHDQAESAVELDRLVAERTRALAEANENLRKSEVQLAEAQRLSLTGSFIWCPTTGFMHWSAQTYRLFDYDPAMPLEPDRIYERILPDDEQGFRDVIEKARTSTGDFDCEFRVKSADGMGRSLHFVIRARYEPDGCLAYYGAIQDVTERRRAEQEAVRRERRMAEMRNELAHANRLATVGQLSTSISHDVRQPLASLVLSSRAGLNWLACAQPNINAARIAFERIQAAGQRASEILDRTKAFARKAQPSKEFVEINTIVADTVALIAPDARRRAIAVSADLTEGLAAPFSDRVQIQQVILNLAVNAMEAMDGPHEGPRQVMIRTWKASEDAVGVGVCDTGPGVPQERRGRLFDAFYTTKPGGMGMGLAICRDIIEAHGGKLWMVPNEPGGAAFHLTLPLLSDRDCRLERGGATP